MNLWFAWNFTKDTVKRRRIAAVIWKRHSDLPKGPIIRITPTLLLVSDATKLPDIYHRYADKSRHYVTGSFGTVESLFNMQDSKQHARFRKVAAGSYRYVSSLYTCKKPRD
jgi:hypothetical protein